MVEGDSIPQGPCLVGGEPMYYNNEGEFVEAVGTYVSSPTAEGEESTVEFVVYNTGTPEEPIYNAYDGEGNPIDPTTPELWGGNGYTQYGDFIVDSDNHVYYKTDKKDDEGYTIWETQDGHRRLDWDGDDITGSHSFANFQFSMLQLGTGYMQFGTWIWEKSGGDKDWFFGHDVSTWLKSNSPFNLGFFSWIGSTKQGYESSMCEQWSDGSNWPANYMLGDDGLPAIHIEGEIVNYTWINQSNPPMRGEPFTPDQKKLVEVYKISFEVNPKKELTDDDYIEFQVVIGGNNIIDLNGPEEEDGENVKLETGSVTYYKKGPSMLIRTSNMEGWEDYTESTEFCLVFTNDFNSPFDKSAPNGEMCNSFAKVEEPEIYDPKTGIFGWLFGIGGGEAPSGSSGGSSGGSEEEGENRP